MLLCAKSSLPLSLGANQPCAFFFGDRRVLHLAVWRGLRRPDGVGAVKP